jgi:hypothetical protein
MPGGPAGHRSRQRGPPLIWDTRAKSHPCGRPRPGGDSVRLAHHGEPMPLCLRRQAKRSVRCLGGVPASRVKLMSQRGLHDHVPPLQVIGDRVCHSPHAGAVGVEGAHEARAAQTLGETGDPGLGGSESVVTAALSPGDEFRTGAGCRAGEDVGDLAADGSRPASPRRRALRGRNRGRVRHREVVDQDPSARLSPCLGPPPRLGRDRPPPGRCRPPTVAARRAASVPRPAGG